MPNLVCLLANGIRNTCEAWFVDDAGAGVALTCPTCGNKLVALSPDQTTSSPSTPGSGSDSPDPTVPVVVPTAIAPVGGPPPVIESDDVEKTDASVVATSDTEATSPEADPTPTPVVASTENVPTSTGATPEETSSSVTDPTDPDDDETSMEWVAVPSTETSTVSTDVVNTDLSSSVDSAPFDDYVVASQATQIPEIAPESDEDDATVA